ncbi:hypothetical protein TCAL_10813 [Tigriopus californicus]|uniref:Bifunctional glutamate/proline--tRNA ligase n=1 Tax=Tigriopus californicus TaxID=6832 RepID=A0A553NFG7_TIGCA|nr:hypothetical protein TCAL_10813 [Tigriopus californicus]
MAPKNARRTSGVSSPATPGAAQGTPSTSASGARATPEEWLSCRQSPMICYPRWAANDHAQATGSSIPESEMVLGLNYNVLVDGVFYGRVGRVSRSAIPWSGLNPSLLARSVFTSEDTMRRLQVGFSEWVEIRIGTHPPQPFRVFPLNQRAFHGQIVALPEVHQTLNTFDPVGPLQIRALPGCARVWSQVRVSLESDAMGPDVSTLLRHVTRDSWVGVGTVWVVPYYGRQVQVIVRHCQANEQVDDTNGTSEDLALLETQLDQMRLSAHEDSGGLGRITHRTIISLMEDTTESEAVLDETASPSFHIGGLQREIEIIRKASKSVLNPVPKKKSLLRPTNGIVLWGHAGTGKSVLGSNLGALLGVNQVNVSSSELMSQFYGQSEESIQLKFEEAIDQEPCVLFLDDLELLCPKKDDGSRSDQGKRVMAALFTQMDKLHSQRKRILVIGATPKISDISENVLRPGRFDFHVEIGVPNARSRLEILTSLLELVDHQVSAGGVQELADVTHGFVGADLRALIIEAESQAESQDGRVLSLDHLKAALVDVKPSAMREVLVEIPNVTWDDIGGLDDIKLALQQAVEWPLKRPDVFTRFAITPPKGVLMYGPPGCSKTMIDALGSERGGSGKVGDRVLAQILTEMDGVEQLKDVTIVAATNRPDMIDKALIRPGRLDRHFYVPLPDEETRRKVFQVHTRKKPLASDVSFDSLVLNTQGYSGAEIAAICNEAALKALEEDIEAQEITWEHFRQALATVKPRNQSDFMNLEASKKNPPFGAVLMAKVTGNGVKWAEQTRMNVGQDIALNNSATIIRYLARSAGHLNLYGNDILSRTKIDHWLSLTIGPLSNVKEFLGSINYIESVVEPTQYMVNNIKSAADYALFGSLFGSGFWQGMMANGTAPTKTKAWYEFMENQPEVKPVVMDFPKNLLPTPTDLPKPGPRGNQRRRSSHKDTTPKGAKPTAANAAKHQADDRAKAKQTKDEGKFVELPGAEMGKVVVRFPPEASGFLHIGHAKAVLLNQHYQQHFQGKLILRFDDTNPAKEKEEFEEVILHDLKLLQVKYDHFSRTSDHFETMLKYCEKLLKEGKAFVDDTDAETMKAEREQRQNSTNRDNNVEKNLKMWEEMKKGSEMGQKCAVMSKRKLTWFVENGYVDGWEDPRFPTVRGVLRRGLTIEALKQFIVAQGSSRSVVFMEWDKIWAMNKKVIDPVAPRYTTVDKTYNVTVHLAGVKECATQADLHPKDPSIGQKTIWQSSQILIDGTDADALVEGTNATFINWGNMTIKKIVRNGNKVVSVEAEPNLDNKDFKKTLKVTWLAQTAKASSIPTIQVYYDHIIKKAVLDKDDDFKQYIGEETKFEMEFLGDPEFVKLKKGDIIQVQRRGFFIVDQPYSPPSANSCKPVPIRLIAIPDGTPTSYGPPGKSVAKIPQTQPSGKGKSAGGGNKKSTPKATSVGSGGDAPAIHDKIVAQGEIVRSLKSNKSGKAEIDQAVKTLLDLKAQYKSATGSEWKPGILTNIKTPTTTTAKPTGKNHGDELNDTVTQQGDLVRKLKSDKASKADIDQAVKSLLAAKAEYKKATGKDWKPGAHVTEPESGPSPVSDNGDLNAKVIAQGDLVRKLKGEKADKAQVDAAVKSLLDLKAQFKTATGSEWKPGLPTSTKSTSKAATAGGDTGSGLNDQITQQGDLVRQLKVDKADKAKITAAVQTLLDLKAQFKTATGQDWKPGNPANPPPRDNKKSSSPSKTTTFELSDLEKDLQDNIAKQGDVVRKLKGEKADKADVDANIKILLDLKAKFKEKLGRDWTPPANTGDQNSSGAGGRKGGGGGGARKPKEKKANKPETAAKKEDNPTGQTAEDNPTGQKVTRLGMEAKKSESLSDWYSQIIVKGELLEYYDVSGCYILRPWAFSIWEKIVAFFDEEIKKLGVENCYFPMFVSQTALQKEKDHIADFSPEVAWVTKSGDSELAEPIAIRPTSETIMYPAFAKWIQSHRDLPLRINQWSNVVRWEFKQPQPFLRTREFLWQEGHTAFATQPEADKEVLQILDLYRRIYEDLLAIPVIPGRKTEKEKFAGGDYTTTVEAYIAAAGRSIQGATSHHLGQNFSKMFDVTFESPETGEKQFVFQNSWGLTTRTLGVLVMVHGDDKGLVLPPNVANFQVVVVPCGISGSDEDRKSLYEACQEYVDTLQGAGIRVRGDMRENVSPGWKFNHWELKGVPVRLELGPRDMKKNQYMAVRRDTGAKIPMEKANVVAGVKNLLDSIQSDMFQKAKADLESHHVSVDKWADFVAALDQCKTIEAPFCGDKTCEEIIKEESKNNVEVEEGAPSMGAKSLCIPFKPLKTLSKNASCVKLGCSKPAQFYTLFGRSY